MNEEQRKSMELAKQVVTSFLEHNNAAEMREILKDPDNWEGLQRSHGDNYYEKLVLRSIRGLMPDEIIIVLKLCYQKRQPSISKKDFANRIYYINETTPNGYKLSDTHRQIISEWAETESEQPQQENELPERVRKGLNDNVLLEMFDNNKDKLKGFLLICEKAKKGESIVKEANRLKLFDNNTIKKVHDKIYGIFGKKVTGYDNWKTYAEIKR
jgi:hypothetical protein